MSELKAFAGLHQAIARLCLRDGRQRREIAEAAEINPSVFSGYCSGRRVPSLEHLDRILTVLDMGVEDLTYELRSVAYRSPGGAPLVLWPQFFEKREGEGAALMLTTLLEEVRSLLRAQQARDLRSTAPTPVLPVEDDTPADPSAATAPQRKGRQSASPRRGQTKH
ncbi:MAG TPA: helix-turn-helix transcriptional regulator [Thermoanaerobaculia bacterium]|nr:helix-turn-helix transcriptional regulator [Thermoanaerobaculia bacterium]